MKVSLIVSTYNSVVALSKVLGSIVLQKRLPDELIIADDGSGKWTADTIRDFSSNAPFPVVHVWQEDKGFRLAKIRNKALRGSKGEYIILLDGDCVVNKYFVQDHISLAEEGCFVQGKRVLVHQKAVEPFTPEVANSLPQLIKLSCKLELSNIHHIIRMSPFPSSRNRKMKGIKSCNMSFFRKDVFAVNGFNEDFVGWGQEDSDLACRLYRFGLLRKVHPFLAICFHLWHPSNCFVKKENRDLLQKTLESQEYYCANGIEKHDPVGEI